MDTVLNAIASWPVMMSRAFTEHTLAAAVVTIAALGIFVLLQQEWRPHRLVTNIWFVAVGWLVSVSVLVPALAWLRRSWRMFESALPLAAKLFAYLYAICERHPIVALVIVGAGTTAYFLRRAWPAAVSWAPVRAVCAVLGVALLIHIAGPIADLVEGKAPVSATAAPREHALDIPAEEAVARAIKKGDNRYVSVRQCVDEVAGYPATEGEVSPWTIGVKGLGATCYESLGHEGDARMRKRQEYAAEYNRRMHAHNQQHRREQLSAR